MPTTPSARIQQHLLHLICGIAVGYTCAAVSADESGDHFESRIRPLLTSHCIECHGPDEQSGGLRLDSRAAILQGGDHGPAAVPGSPQESLMLQAVARTGDLQMPPEEALPATTVDALAQWIRDGLTWPDTAAPLALSIAVRARTHWAYQPIQDPAVPDYPGETPIDAFLLQRLHQAGLDFSAEADSRTLLRRLSYVTSGIPPQLSTVQSVDTTDTAAWMQLVEQLLSSRASAEHRARQWLDLARYSDTKGYVYGREQRFWTHAWSYRNWLISAIQEDLPYDRFLTLQIAADLVPDARPEDAAAMGFLTLGRRFLGVRRDIIDDQIDVLTRGTMSLTVACARCHDHKYDPIPTADYYSLYGVFNSSRESLRMLPPTTDQQQQFLAEYETKCEEQHQLRQERRQKTSARIRERIADYLAAQLQLDRYPEAGFDQILAATDLLPSFVHRWRDYLLLAEQTADPIFIPWHAYRNLTPEEFAARTAEVTREIQNLPELTVHPHVLEQFRDAPQSFADVIQRYASLFLQTDKDWQQAQSDPAATGLSDEHAESLRRVLYHPSGPCFVPDEPIMSTEGDYDTATCNELWKKQVELEQMILNSPAQPAFALLLTDRAAAVSPRILVRGNPAQPGELVPLQAPQLLAGTDRQPFSSGSGRLQLAHVIASRDNPLTARVAVNRVWLSIFGQGLVATPGDFGMRSAPPSHPQLLDWLASRLIEDGWSIRSLYRRILATRAFRQASASSALHAQAEEIDPANHLLWKMNLHRLSFEELRDSLLSASGTLDSTPATRPAELLKAPWNRRRTIYGLVDRQFLPAAFRTFDFASPDLHTPSRSQTTIPQQALFLMNHPLALEQTRALAETVRDLPPAEQVRGLYERTLQRSPGESEEQACIALLNTPAPPAITPPPTAAQWSYGFGAVNEQEQRVDGFTALPLFNGTAWQGGEAFPDARLGWVQLTADGGHPGNDRQHACVRRWTAPAAGTLKVHSTLKHEPAAGDGIRAFIISSRQGTVTSLGIHQAERTIDHAEIAVEPGDTLDFVVDIGDQLNSDQFLWEIEIRDSLAAEIVWNSRLDFTPQHNPALTPLEQLAQVLLCSNEFLFVD